MAVPCFGKLGRASRGGRPWRNGRRDEVRGWGGVVALEAGSLGGEGVGLMDDELSDG